MLTQEHNERLTRVGPGSPCGELMRRYWQPIAASSQLPSPGTKAIRILGEDLVLYRDPRGGLGLLEPHCAHRRAGLVFGMPEEGGLRCTYHGWLYDASGQCIEQPYETFLDSTSRFKDKIRIQAYPVEELGGLVFAYLGPEPRPLLPRWEAFVRDDVKREIGIALLPCNWLQAVENVGDSSHIVTVHWQFSQYVLDQLGRSELRRHERSSGSRGYSPRKKEMSTSVGHGGLIFPNIDAQEDCYQIRVPIDDTQTMHIFYMFFTSEDEETLGVSIPVQQYSWDIPTFEIPMPRLDEHGQPPWAMLDGNDGQDHVMWWSQGSIMDRTREHLGQGDENIIHVRRLLDEQIRVVEDGGDPMNTFRDPSTSQCLSQPEPSFKPWRLTPDGRPSLTTAARKHSAVYRQATVNKLGQNALNDPVH